MIDLDALLNPLLPKIHLADPGRATLYCGVKERVVNSFKDKNWSWSPEKVTCKRCLAKYQKQVRERRIGT